MATELTDLDLGEWSICIDPANEDSTIEIVKSKTGLHVPVLKETDMSDNNEHIEEADDGADEFIAGLQEAYDNMSEEERFEAFAETVLDNVDLEEAVEDATEVVKALTENTVTKEKYETLLKSATNAANLIEKMKTQGHVTVEEGGLVNEIRKANGGADLSPEAAARIEAVEKSLAETADKEAIAKARTYGFGDPNEVAPLLTRIRKGKATPADADKVEALIKQAGAVVAKSGLFKSIGEDAGNADASSPIAKAKASISDIKKANPGFTDAQAMTKYWADNPDEYAAHQAQRASAA